MDIIFIINQKHIKNYFYNSIFNDNIIYIRRLYKLL